MTTLTCSASLSTSSSVDVSEVETARLRLHDSRKSLISAIAEADMAWRQLNAAVDRVKRTLPEFAAYELARAKVVDLRETHENDGEAYRRLAPPIG